MNGLINQAPQILNYELAFQAGIAFAKLRIELSDVNRREFAAALTSMGVTLRPTEFLLEEQIMSAISPMAQKWFELGCTLAMAVRILLQGSTRLVRKMTLRTVSDCLVTVNVPADVLNVIIDHLSNLQPAQGEASLTSVAYSSYARNLSEIVEKWNLNMNRQGW